MPSNEICTALVCCARCGQDHERLRFFQFQRPVVDNDGTVWSHWATCPTYGEPVLLKVT